MVEDRANFNKLTQEKDDKILKLEAEMSKLKKKLDEVSENLEVEKKKYEIA
jgi:peptidoglycan hydrolase CwlO-like protein